MGRPSMMKMTGAFVGAQALKTTFNELALSSQLPPKVMIPAMFEKQRQADQQNPNIPVVEVSESTFRRHCNLVFGSNKTVQGKYRNANRINGINDPRVDISHAVVTATGFKGILPIFAANCDTATIAMGPRIGQAAPRTRITPEAHQVFFPLPGSDKLVYCNKMLSCCPILIRTDLFQKLKSLHVQPGMQAPTGTMAFRLIPTTAFITAGEFVEPLVFAVFKDGNMKSKPGFPPLPTGVVEVRFKLSKINVFYIPRC